MALTLRWLFAVVPLVAQISACSAPTKADINGVFRGSGGASLEFRQDGTFTARSLPRAVFFPGIEFGETIDGSGQWRLNRSNGLWRVGLDFDRSAALPLGYSMFILVSGSGPELTLFEWIGEAGGDRFEFKR